MVHYLQHQCPTADGHLHTTFRNGHIDLSELKLLRLEKDDFTWRIGYHYNVYFLFFSRSNHNAKAHEKLNI